MKNYAKQKNNSDKLLLQLRCENGVFQKRGAGSGDGECGEKGLVCANIKGFGSADPYYHCTTINTE